MKNEKKVARIVMDVRPEEKKELKRLADEQNLNLTAYLKLMGLKKLKVD